MFGIGLPEMIVIFAVALIVVGPDKLPGLARSLAKGLMELKKTLNQVKDNLTQEGEVLDSVHKDLKKTAEELRGKMIDVDPSVWQASPADPAKENSESNIVDMQPVHTTAEDKELPKEAVSTSGTGERPQPPSHSSDQPLATHQENQQANSPEKTP